MLRLCERIATALEISDHLPVIWSIRHEALDEQTERLIDRLRLIVWNVVCSTIEAPPDIRVEKPSDGLGVQ
jgi:hypothetical protein